MDETQGSAHALGYTWSIPMCLCTWTPLVEANVPNTVEHLVDSNVRAVSVGLTLKTEVWVHGMDLKEVGCVHLILAQHRACATLDIWMSLDQHGHEKAHVMKVGEFEEMRENEQRLVGERRDDGYV